MALTLGDNFSYQGAKPLDARLVYSTVASMKAVADSTMYDGCLAYCTATDKTYQWKSTNAVDETTGKWREFTSGGGSSVVSGYYKEADHLFYEESTYTTPIAGAANTIYISVDTNKSYRYNSSIFVRIDEEEGQVVQIATLPTASASNLGKIYEYVGATTQDYTNGVFYQCVFDGTSTYSWEVCDVVDTLSASDVQDIKDTFVVPTTSAQMPILFDETGAEQVVGWHKLANGTKLPVYRKIIDCGSIPSGANQNYTLTTLTGISNFYPICIYAYIDATGIGIPRKVLPYLQIGESEPYGLSAWHTINASDEVEIHCQSVMDRSNMGKIAVVAEYTKNSDTPV